MYVCPPACPPAFPPAFPPAQYFNFSSEQFFFLSLVLLLKKQASLSKFPGHLPKTESCTQTDGQKDRRTDKQQIDRGKVAWTDRWTFEQIDRRADGWEHEHLER
jgi:hypothetical protein